MVEGVCVLGKLLESAPPPNSRPFCGRSGCDEGLPAWRSTASTWAKQCSDGSNFALVSVGSSTVHFFYSAQC